LGSLHWQIYGSVVSVVRVGESPVDIANMESSSYSRESMVVQRVQPVQNKTHIDIDTGSAHMCML
jgi:hypothetical protein